MPHLNWRYILFKWNDSDEEMNRARALAAEIGVDRLSWEITDHPENAFSRRFAPGTADYEAIKHEIWDISGLGNAIPGATPKAKIDVRAMAPAIRAAVEGARREEAEDQDADRERLRAAVSRQGQLRPAPGAGSARSSATRTARCWSATTRARGCRRR